MCLTQNPWPYEKSSMLYFGNTSQSISFDLRPTLGFEQELKEGNISNFIATGVKRITECSRPLSVSRRSSWFVEFPFQFPWTFECDNPPRSEHHRLTCGRISAPSLRLLIHAELSEAADKNILAWCEGSFDDLKKGFGYLGRFFPCESGSFHNGL